MNQPVITILCGGVSEERSVSLCSGEAIRGALQQTFNGNVEMIDLRKEELPGGLDPARHVIFPALHGRFGEDGRLQALLDKRRFAYAGCAAAASRLCMDKAATKRHLSAHGVRVVPGITLRPGKTPPAGDAIQLLGGDLVLKPAAQGSSVGLALIQGREALAEALASLNGGGWILEKRIQGREISVGLLGGKAMGLVEILPAGGVYDYRHKYTQGLTQYQCPAGISEKTACEIREMAQLAFAVCGCRDFARADFMVSAGGRPYCLEINTIPGLTATSLLPKSASCLGFDFPELSRRMAVPALARYQQLQAA